MDDAKPWLRCYRCWSTDLEIQVHYEGIHKIDPETGERADVVDQVQEAVVQCLECMHDQTCSGPEAGDALSFAAFGDHGTREFFTHVRFHKHEDDNRIVVHLLVELYARSAEEAAEVLEEAARGTLAITSLAEESRPPAATEDRH
jgi:hypothetical protein